MFENDISLIQDALIGLQQRIEDEHSAVHNVLINMIAILKSKFNRGKIESRHILETILKRDPKNLNALADFEQLCRDHHRITEADKYKMRINNIMEGNTVDDRRAKATCLMEQGYAILYEESANKEQLSKDKLSESYRMLLSEQRKAMRKRKDHSERCIYHTKQVPEQIQHVIDSEGECESDLHHQQTTTIDKFNQAQQIYDLQSENPIWLFYEGVAWNRRYDSLKEMIRSGVGINRKEEKKKATFMATKILWKVAHWPEHGDEIVALYRSRALALIAHILTPPERYHYFFEDRDNQTSMRRNQLFKEFLQNPMRPIEMALMSHQNDIFILNRYGRILWNVSNKQKNLYEKKELLHKALRILNNSIEIRKLNWFAYTTRMSVKKDLATTYLGDNPKESEAFLKLALEDWYQCFATRATAKTICILVDISRYKEAQEKKEYSILLLKDFLYTLENGYKKYGKIDNICDFLCKNDADNLLSLFEHVISIPQILDQGKVNLVSIFLDHSINKVNIHPRHKRRIKACRNKITDLKVDDVIEPSFSEMYQTGISTIPPIQNAIISSVEYTYDFFVSYSHKDSDWVLSRLLADLETAFTEEDVIFKGCIADRDFTPGQSIIKNILNSIKKSAKILLVLSENFVQSHWCQYEADHALFSSLNDRRDCVIPLLLEDCKIPEKLLHITYADFTDDAEYIHGIMKLKRALLPG